MRKGVAFLVVLTTMMAFQPAQAVDNCPFPDGKGSYHKGTFTVRHVDAADVVAWQIWLTGESCVNGKGIITAHRWNKRHYVNPNEGNFWEWIGWTDTQNGGGDGQRHVFRRVNAALKLCYPAPVGCVKKAEPWVQITMTNSWPWVEVDGDKGMS